MKKKKLIFCTLGPSSLNKKFLKFSNNKVDLLRLNMSHIQVSKLEKTIKFVKKYTKVPICIDTEGAQIRSKCKRKKFFKFGTVFKFYKRNSFFGIYPNDIFKKLKKNDILSIGFSGLVVKIFKITSKNIFARVVEKGLFENNKGIHIINRKINIEYLTDKDFKAIKIAKKCKIKNFALSFTNTLNDIKKFDKLLKNENKIYKLETLTAINNLKKILPRGKKFLIDRGDLSKDISIEMIPVAQRKIIKMGNKMGKEIYVATNFLENMLTNNYPTRGEVNDIYNTLEMGAKGLVLAAETAIGKYPIECIKFLKKIIGIYYKYNKSRKIHTN